MGSTPGKMNYEFKNKGRVEKAVATEVEVVSSEELEKSVAQEVKVADPVDAEAVIVKAKAEAAEKEKAKADAEAKLKEEEKKKEVKKEEVVDGGTENPTVPKEDIKEPQQ